MKNGAIKKEIELEWGNDGFKLDGRAVTETAFNREYEKYIDPPDEAFRFPK
jgi:hypothetical protein